MKKSERILTMQRCIVGDCIHEITCTNIGTGWNIRVLLNGEVNQEVRVYSRFEIAKAAREMLRMEDKCGNISKFASAARTRGYK
jgi:hypothetical protein